MERSADASPIHSYAAVAPDRAGSQGTGLQSLCPSHRCRWPVHWMGFYRFYIGSQTLYTKGLCPLAYPVLSCPQDRPQDTTGQAGRPTRQAGRQARQAGRQAHTRVSQTAEGRHLAGRGKQQNT